MCCKVLQNAIVLFLIFPLLGLGLRRDQSYYANRWTSAANDPFGPALKSSVKFISGISDQIIPGISDKLPKEGISPVISGMKTTNKSNASPDNQLKREMVQIQSNQIQDNSKNGSIQSRKIETSLDDRDKRIFFKPFTDFFSNFIFVKNISCVSPSGDNGTCYRDTACTNNGGMSSGTCGNNTFGVCCIFIKSCGDSSNQNVSYFTNNGYPNSFDSVGSCQMTINKLNSDICQLRLDFIDFTIQGANATSSLCDSDRFTVSGSKTGVPVICGVNTGNHMYINLGPGVTSPTILSFITMGGSFARKWKVKVTQIPCNTDYTAPNDCLQYFTGITGQVKTYNFGFDSGGQLASQDYTSCIRTERSFCGIQYVPCTDTAASSATTVSFPRSFTISGTAGTTGSQVGPLCTTDWVIIPCATASVSTGTSFCFDRFCGSLLNIATQATPTAGNAPLFSFIKPFNIIYHTDASEVPNTETLNRGYCLNYVQQPCT